MDFIFIDTAIFEQENFLEGNAINQILSLAEDGRIQILLPDITLNEIKSRGTKNIRLALEGHNKYRAKTRILRNVPTAKNYFPSLDEESIVNEFLIELDRKIVQAKCRILPYPTVNIKNVFDKYFNNTFPFNKGEKKHEFPDAFALITIEKWCEKHHTKCLVLTKDKDLLNYESTYLTFEKDYGIWLDNKLRQIEKEKLKESRLKAAEKLFEENKPTLLEEIVEWSKEQLQDESTYEDFVNQYDIHNVELRNLNVEFWDTLITSVTNHDIKFLTEVVVSFEVEIEFDDENNGIYDSEDKEWHAFGTVTEVIRQTHLIPIDLVVDFPILGDEFTDIKIYEINRGNVFTISNSKF